MYAYALAGAGVGPASAAPVISETAIAAAAQNFFMAHALPIVCSPPEIHPATHASSRGDRDLLRIDRRIMRHVVVVTHDQLQRVFARRPLDSRIGFARSEMQVLAI